MSIDRETGFWVAQALVLSPPGLGHVRVSQPYEELSSSLEPGKSSEAIAWEFVVTKDGATSVDSIGADTAKGADRMATDWSWTSSGAQKAGDSRCGGSGSGGAGAGGPLVEFVSVCHS